MYSIRPNIVIGFHGCRKDVALNAVSGAIDLHPSQNKYDWLGEGVYFWENDYDRALEFAQENNDHEASVLGAVFYLGNCLDLTTRKGCDIVKHAYNNLIKPSLNTGLTNKPGNRGGATGDIKLRFLDCAVITALHQFHQDQKLPEFDTIKAAFWEGEELYPSAGFREKNHIQICIRNPKCILGYFLPKQ